MGKPLVKWIFGIPFIPYAPLIIRLIISLAGIILCGAGISGAKRQNQTAKAAVFGLIISIIAFILNIFSTVIWMMLMGI
jgi:hypothetical protein